MLGVWEEVGSWTGFVGLSLNFSQLSISEYYGKQKKGSLDAIEVEATPELQNLLTRWRLTVLPSIQDQVPFLMALISMPCTYRATEPPKCQQWHFMC